MSAAPAASSDLLTAEAFDAAMAPFALPPGARIAVAVSGGADSLALTLLLAAWSKRTGADLAAITVDHRLRPESAGEAAQVAAWLVAAGVRHVTLTWDAGAVLPPGPSRQKAARDARYGLMEAFCANEARSHLFLAHHADDQVETFLIRLSRGSGVNGLAAMAATTVRGGLILARPLLAYAKDDLRAVCEHRGQPWIDDPSNENTASARVRFRQAAGLLAAEGLTRARLLDTVGHLQRAREALEMAVSTLLAAFCRWDDFGCARLAPGWHDAPAEIALRALARLLTAAGGQIYGPRFENLEGLYQRCLTGPWRDATLHGCQIVRDGGDLLFAREAAHVDDVKPLAQGPVIWDRRFRITWPDAPRDSRIAALGTATLPETTAYIPHRLRGALPAIFDSTGLVAVPHAQFLRDDAARASATGPEVACITALNERAALDHG